MLCFQKDIYKINNAFANVFSLLPIQTNKRNIMMGQLIRKKCLDAIMLGKVSLFPAPWNIRCNKRINIVHGLIGLEERLVSLRITFAQIM